MTRYHETAGEASHSAAPSGAQREPIENAVLGALRDVADNPGRVWHSAARLATDRILDALAASPESGRERFPEGLVVSAVRYALGRATYVVSETTEWLREHWSELRPGTRETILRDVLRALAANDVGMTCDRREWESIAALAPEAETPARPAFRHPVLSAKEAAAQQAARGTTSNLEESRG